MPMLYRCVKSLWLLLVLTSCAAPAVEPRTVNSIPDENAEIPVLLDFGVMGGSQQPCYCVSGPCRDMPAPPSPVLRESLSTESLPAKRSFDFQVPDVSIPYHVFLYVKANAHNTSELKLNGKSIGSFTNSIDFYSKRHKHFQNLRLQHKNRLDVEIQGMSPVKLELGLQVRPEDPRLAYCIGEVAAWNRQDNQDWQSVLKSPPYESSYIAMLDFYAGNPEARLSEHAVFSRDLSEKNQAEFLSRLSRIGHAINRYKGSKREPLTAVSFSSPLVMDALIVTYSSTEQGDRLARLIATDISNTEHWATIFPTPFPSDSPSIAAGQPDSPAPTITPSLAPSPIL